MPGDILPLAGIMIPIVFLMIPIVAILTSHQRKMAEIMHSRPQVPTEEIQALRREVADLRQLVHQQAISLDGRSNYVPAPPISEQLSNY